jgi:hypothetical protein
MEFSYDDPTNFKLIFSNRLRLDDGALQFSDLFNQTINNGITTTVNSDIWKNWSEHKDDVTTFIDSALDTAKNAVTNGANQEFIIDSTGLRARYLDPNTGDYSDNQIWVINDLIVFTDDNWDSAKLALGQITLESGVTVFGLVAEALIGKILIGNELLIANENNTFSVDRSGATLSNASFSLLRDDGNSKLFLDPSIGISISKRDTTTGSYIPQLSIDSQGNVMFAGNLQAAGGTFSGNLVAPSGTIGGWTINSDGLSSSTGDYINSNGNIHLSMLTITPTDAYFNGNIYANNLQGLVQAYQIGSVDAGVITTGVLSAIDIYGCNIYWPGVHMYQDTIGRSLIEADKNIILETGINTLQSAGITIASADNGGTINIFTNNFVTIGPRFGQTGTPTIFIQGNIMTKDSYNNTGTGISGTFVL